MPKFDSELETFITTIKDNCVNEDRGIYSEQQSLLRRNELWYHGLQYLYWDFSAGDWATFPSLNYPFAEDTRRGTDDYYDYVINIMQAHGETFIAALSAEIPSVVFPPADMNSPDDISTAKAYNKISEMLDIHNPAKYLWIRALFTKWNQGMVAIYGYTDTDEKYGTVKVPKYVNDPTGKLVLHSIEKQPKTRVLFDIKGTIDFKIPYYAKTEDAVSYLVLTDDQDYTLMQEIFDDDDIQPSGSGEGSRQYRLPTNYTVGLEAGNDLNNLVTVQRVWVKPYRFRIIKKTSPRIYKNLMDKYPSGALFTYVGKKLKDIEEQNLSDHWTFSRSGTSSHLTSDPKCSSILPIQEITNTVGNLSVDILEHSIPETFATPEALNFDEYGKIETAPGFIYKANIPPGMKSLADAFSSPPKAQLSPSLAQYTQELETTAQFLIGNNPAVWGGSMGSRTPASEYSQSRAQSLQRWGLVYHEMKDLWTRAKVKGVKAFVKNMSDTEKFTTKKGNQSLTVYIERHAMTGEVGDVTPDDMQMFPMTAEQKQEWLMKLLELKSPEIEAFLMHPSNREVLAQLLAFPGLHVPGSGNRLKQLIEFTLLSKQKPVDDTTPSIQPDFDVDDHTLHAAELRTLLVSETGLELRQKNPLGYLNNILHLRLHVKAEQAQMQKPYGASAPGHPAPTTAKSSQE